MSKLSFATLVCAAAAAAAAIAVVPASAEHSYVRTVGSPAVTGRIEETEKSAGLCDPNVTQHSGYFKIEEQGKTNQNVGGGFGLRSL